jgi:hypothetical protein
MEVKINGKYLELGDSSPAITKKSIDIDSPSTRFMDFTNKFTVPATDANRAVFENPYVIGSNNRSFDKLYNVEIEDIFRIFFGTGFLDGSTFDKFNLQVVDESTNLFSNIDVRLNKIKWDDQDAELTEAYLNAHDTANLENCWVWGKLCLHENALIENTDQTTGTARLKYSRPCFSVQGFLKRAIILQGYNYVPSTVELAISAWHDKFYFTSYQKILSIAYNNESITGLDTNDFQHADLTVSDTAINIGTKKTLFRLRGTITSDASCEFIIRATDNSDPTKITESKLQIGVGETNVDFTTSEFYAETGMTIDVRLSGDANVSIAGLLYTLLNDKDFDLSTNPFVGYLIKVYDNLPDLTYLDLFKLICVVGNQFQKVDVYNKIFSWDTMANLGKMNSVDWSDKFIQTSESTTNSFTGVFQKNWLKYTNDITVNPQKGWGSFRTDNEKLAVEGDYLILKFGASNDVAINSNQIAHVKLYSNTSRILTQTVNMRLFEINGSNLSFEPLSWSNLAEKNYGNWFMSLYRIRQINADFNLSKMDVITWHEKQLVYIDYFKTTFIVLEISNFIPGKKTKVKLLAYGR